MVLEAYALTDKGGRSHNEDSQGFLVDADGSSGIFVVADGLGGHSCGEVASSLAVSDLLDAWSAAEGPVDMEWLQESVEKANRHIVEEQKARGNRMRTTVVALVIQGGRALWAHAGDSRLYHLHNGQIASVTSDHSVAFSKYRSGEIEREDIATDPDQSRLLNTLGNSEGVRVECAGWNGELGTGDSFFICTDGVWEYLHDTEILIDRLKSANPKEWVTHCLYRTLARVPADHDNLTALAVTINVPSANR